MLWILNYGGVHLVLLATLLIWIYWRFSYDYWRKLNVNSLKPVPVFGNIMDYVLGRKSYHEVLDDLYKAAGNQPFAGIYLMREPFFLIKDPKLVSSVLIGDFKSFTSRGPVLYFSRKRKAKGDMTMNVALASGDRWKMLRQKMRTAFTVYKMKSMLEQVFYSVAQLSRFMDQRMKNTESVDMDVKNLGDRFSAETIGLCFLGVQCHCFEKEHIEFLELCEQLFATQPINIVRLLVSSIFGKQLWHKLNLPDAHKKATDYFKNMNLDVVNHRRHNQQMRNDFMQLLLSMQNSHEDPNFAVPNNGQVVPENEEFNEMDIAANAFVLYVAAFETVSSALSFCLYELALNENIQVKLRSEVLRVKDQCVELTYNSLKEMTYLEAVITETLRKYPPAPFLTRQAVEDYVIPETNILVPAGTKVIIPSWSIQHDWRYYPNPEAFDPERFTGDRKYNLSSGIYLPFGDGPRNCFGKKFAYVELKVAISTIILKYHIKPCDKTEIPLKFSGGSLPLHTSGVWVNFVPRKTNVPSQL